MSSQAFRNLLEDNRATDRFELLSTVERPLPGDIWLKAEVDEEDELEEYDDFLEE